MLLKEFRPVDKSAPHRPIRSFVRREGRITAAQQRALAEHWPRFGLAADAPIDLAALFPRRAPTFLEIGFGNGEALAAAAAANPTHNFIGIEVHRPGVGNLLRALAAADADNVRVVCADAVAVLRDALPPAALAGAFIFFPDPWHKTRHHKRRLIQPEFVALLAARLQPGAVVHLATDWRDYAEHMLAVFAQAPGWVNLAGDARFVPRPPTRPVTKFERRGERLGHATCDMLFRYLG